MNNQKIKALVGMLEESAHAVSPYILSLAHSILAEEEAEKAKEKVLSIGTFYSVNIALMDGRNVYKAIASNCRGRIVFIADGGGKVI